MFMFGGIGGWSPQTSASLDQSHYSVRHDLWRFDVAAAAWTEIRPSRYTMPLRASARSLITPWGLLRTGTIYVPLFVLVDSRYKYLLNDFSCL